MDFDLNFGRFFGFEIDSLRKAESSENVPPKEILNSKDSDFLKGEFYFSQNRRFCSEVEIVEKCETHQKKTH